MILTEEECDLSPSVQTNDSHNAPRDRIIVTEQVQVPRVVCIMTGIVKRASDDGVVIPPWVVCTMTRIVKKASDDGVVIPPWVVCIMNRIVKRPLMMEW